MLKNPLVYVWIAIVGALMLAANLPDRVTLDQLPPSGQADRTADDKDRADRVAATKKDVPKSSVQEQGCATCNEHEKADLYEQRRMADAVEKQNLINVVGSVLLALSLVFTGWAAFAAARAASAAQAAVHTERAWMSHVGLHTGNVVSGDIDGVPFKNGLMIRMGWQNTGRSPAIRTEAFIEHKMVGAGDPVPTFVYAPSRIPLSTSIGPGMTITTAPRGLNEQEYIALRGRTAKVYVYSRIAYFDVFTKVERVTEACGEVDYNGEVMDGRTGKMVPNIGFVPIGAQNSAS